MKQNGLLPHISDSRPFCFLAEALFIPVVAPSAQTDR